MDPVGGLVGGFEIAELGEQPAAERCDCSVPARSSGGLITLPFRRAPDRAKDGSSACGLSSTFEYQYWAAYRSCRPRSRSGASRSSSPAMPTRVNKA